jgi:hypothetical protein
VAGDRSAWSSVLNGALTQQQHRDVADSIANVLDGLHYATPDDAAVKIVQTLLDEGYCLDEMWKKKHYRPHPIFDDASTEEKEPE